MINRLGWNDLEFVKVGNATDEQGHTGLTVLRFPYGAIGGLYISGGGPAARESGVLDPTTHATPLNALVLSGGSAFGLGASDGVMRSLENRGLGYPTAYGVVPIVCQSNIYDLSYGLSHHRPNADMAFAACESTFSHTEPVSGNVGAGTGATVGKLLGMERAMKGGIGYAAVALGELIVAAVVVVNACGNVYNREGHALGGVVDKSGTGILDATNLLYEQYEQGSAESMVGQHQNTTIGAIVTNAIFNKGELTKLAQMATNGYARSIRPVGTLSDGDTIYALTTQSTVKADLNTVGTLAADVMQMAIEDAMHSSQVTRDVFLSNLPEIKNNN